MWALEFPFATNRCRGIIRLPARGAAQLTSPSKLECEFHCIHLRKKPLLYNSYQVFAVKRFLHERINGVSKTKAIDQIKYNTKMIDLLNYFYGVT